MNRAVAREFARAGDVERAHVRPLVRLAVEIAKGVVRLEVGRQVGQMHVGVAVGQQRAAQRLENARLAPAEMIGKDQVERLARLRLVLVVPVRAVPGAAVGDFLGGEAEQEEILFARLLHHLDRRAVARAKRQRPVYHELHVAGAARFVARQSRSGSRRRLRECSARQA